MNMDNIAMGWRKQSYGHAMWDSVMSFFHITACPLQNKDMAIGTTDMQTTTTPLDGVMSSL